MVARGAGYPRKKDTSIPIADIFPTKSSTTFQRAHKHANFLFAKLIFYKLTGLNLGGTFIDIDDTCTMLLTGKDTNVETARNELCKRYSQSRYIPPADDWPPYHPKHYTPLTIVHHEGRRTESEVISIAEKMVTKEVVSSKQYININNSMRNINNLFLPFDSAVPTRYMILIEGAPGIGKTILSKEIALQWAENEILKNKMLLLLLFMRDPQVKYITDIQSLVKYFCFSDSAISKVVEWFIETSGKYLTILLDGYDEASVGNDFIINDIIGRKILTECGLIITSRPAASSHLHDIVDCRAEVLGFTEEDRLDFIHNALQNDINKIEKLKEFFQSNAFLNTLCYIPLNMSILICLAQGGINTLPTTQTSLYQKFIIMTIIHFLKKSQGINTTGITSLNDLPSPYDKVVEELSQFAFLALQKDQLVFTKVEVSAACPNLTPTNWHGLGLLKPAQYFKPEDGCDHESFHFLHYSIQEYMAAYHIASLPNNQLQKLLNDTFWNVHYFNTWALYVGITGGNASVFKHFLSGKHLRFSRWLSGNQFISKKILKDKMKRLHLLYCLTEADPNIVASVEDVFQGEVIDLSKQSLSLNDIRTLVILLLRLQNRKWKMLDLSSCDIIDEGCNVLCEMFQSKHLSFHVNSVDVSANSFSWNPLYKLCNVMRSWHVKEIIISIDMLYDSKTAKLINRDANEIRKAMVNLDVDKPLLSVLLSVTYLVKQNMVVAVCFQPQCISCIQFAAHDIINKLKEYVRALRFTVTDTELNYHLNIENVNTKLAALSGYIECIKIFGESLHSKGAYHLLKSATTIESENSSPHQELADYLSAVVCHSIQTGTSYFASLADEHAAGVQNILRNTTTLTSLNIANNNIGIAAASDIATFLSHNKNLQKLYVIRNNLQTEGAIKIARGLCNTTGLTVFSISDNNIGVEAADDIAILLSHNTKLQELYIAANNLQTKGAIKVARGLQNTSTLTVLSVSNNNIGVEAADDIAAVLSHNIKLQKLYMGQNNLQTEGAIKIARSLQNTSTLTELNISNNNIGAEAADDIATVLWYNTKLQKLYVFENDLQTEGAIKIASSLQDNSNLLVFSVSNNNVSVEAAKYIAIVLFRNTKLEELYIHKNNIKTKGAIKILEGLQNTSTLTVFSISNNNIGVQAADDIAIVLACNPQLQYLYLGGNNLQTEGAIKVARSLRSTTCLIEFEISNNNIGVQATNYIATVLSKNRKLKKLYIGENNLDTFKIASGLHRTKSLTVFSISDTNVGKATEIIAAVLFHNTELQELYMCRNKLQRRGAIIISKGLQNTSTLVSFFISDNHVGVEAADDIATVLSHNIKLQKLYIGGNDLRTIGAIKIARGLQCNSSLVEFNISNNDINVAAASDLATVLSHNTKLQKLYLGGNNLQTEGAIMVSQALQHTSTLTKFDISNNRINVEEKDNIATILSLNIKLQEFYI